jgi:uncharacterized protein YwqG
LVAVNAFWDRWRKTLTHESVPAGARRGETGGLGPALVTELRDILAPVVGPCAAIGLGGPAEDPTGSFLTGHPYLPDGFDWPEGADGPQIFVGQINFAEVGLLPGFPTGGLLQWFVDADDTYGLTFDETAGRVGFSVRWHTDLTAPSTAPPDAPTPTSTLDDLPMEFVGPTALEFRPALSIPGWADLPKAVQADTVWERVAMALGENRADPAFLYEEYVRGGSSPLTEYRCASKVGGYPSFTQDDPRGRAGYPPAGSGRSELIVELDSMDVGGWGDSGIAHLFGDPAGLSAGDTSSIRYHWDCM